jgi:hypothetical protein
MRSTTFVFTVWYTSIQEFGVFGAQTGTQQTNLCRPRPRPCATRGYLHPTSATIPGRAAPEAARAPRRAGVHVTCCAGRTRTPRSGGPAATPALVRRTTVGTSHRRHRWSGSPLFKCSPFLLAPPNPALTALPRPPLPAAGQLSSP